MRTPGHAGTHANDSDHAGANSTVGHPRHPTAGEGSQPKSSDTASGNRMALHAAEILAEDTAPIVPELGQRVFDVLEGPMFLALGKGRNIRIPAMNQFLHG